MTQNDTGKVEILLVDDRQENLLALESVLSSLDYYLAKASSGEEALRYLLDNRPALILLDVNMPDMDGFETASIIKGSERTREIPIIFVAALNKDERRAHKGYDHGAVDYIYKPFDPHVLRSKVAVLAELSRQHQRIVRLVSIQKATTQALAQATNVDEAISTVLNSICTSLGWDVGFFWKVDQLSNALYCHAGWHDSSRGQTPATVSDGVKRRFHSGSGLPGKVWATAEALWITDFKSSEFPRLMIASGDGLRTAVGFPVSIQGETLGVIEIFSRGQCSRDPELVEIMEVIGNQIALVLKRTEAIGLLRSSEARKAAILEGAVDCIISIDRKGRISEFNPAAETTFGLPRSAVVGMDLANVILPHEARQANRQKMGRHIERTEITAMRSDGSEFPAELSITPVMLTDPPLFTVFLRDITLRRREKENAALLTEVSTALSSSFNYDELFQTLAKIVVRSFADRCVIYGVDENGNPQELVFMHRDPKKTEEILRRRAGKARDWSATRGSANVLRTGEPEFYPEFSDELIRAISVEDEDHYRFLNAYGMKSAMAVPILARGKVMGAISLVASESGQAYTQDDFLLAQEMGRRAGIAIDNARLYMESQLAVKARDEFFSIASHELKTPITALKMMLQFTRKGVDPSHGKMPSIERLVKMLDTSNREVDRLIYLVEDLLDVTKIRAGKLSINPVELNLSELIGDVIDRLAEALSDVSCDVEVLTDPAVIGMWDSGRIEQVIVNLLSNAIKYAPGKPIKIGIHSEGEKAKIVVQDFGPGIPREVQSRIFERFERAVSSRNISGLGLGLFIVKTIVEAHSGTIHLESREGFGSKFTVELPMRVHGAGLRARLSVEPGSIVAQNQAR